MKFEVAQVIGLNTDQKAAQVISSNQDGENIFLAVLSLTCDDAFTKGRQFLSETSDYYLDAPGSPAEKINATFKQATGKLKDTCESFDLCITAVSGKILYLISQGKTEVFLKRGDKFSSLLSLGTSGQLISGFLQDGDKVLFATASLASFLGEDLSKTLDLGVEVFEEEISSKVAAASMDQESLAGLLLKINDGEKVEIPVLPESYQSGEPFTQKQEFSINLLFEKILPVLASIRRGFPRSGRAKLILGVILIVILVLGIGFKYKSSQDRQKISAFNQALAAARDNFSKAQSLQGLNSAEAQNNLDWAKSNVNKALSLQPKNQDAQNLKKQIEDNADSILQKFATSNFPVFLDLELVKKNFHADKMSLNSGNLLLLDPGTKSLITINIAKKSNQILAGSDQLGEATSAAINGGLAFVYSKDRGVIRVDITNQKLVTVALPREAGKKDSDLGNIADIYGFGGNVYLLDSTNQKIWKYLPTNEGYSDKREYLSKDAKVDFTNSLRMQIESSVYVLKKGGEILRFTKGDKDNFSLGGLDKGVKDPKSFFVSSDTDNLYLLDSGNSRLLVLSKTGQFKGQYQGDKFGLASDLAVDEAGKKVYLLEGSKIYSADLK